MKVTLNKLNSHIRLKYLVLKEKLEHVQDFIE